MQADQKDLVQIFLLKIKKKNTKIGGFVWFGGGVGWGSPVVVFQFRIELKHPFSQPAPGIRGLLYRNIYIIRNKRTKPV